MTNALIKSLSTLLVALALVVTSSVCWAGEVIMSPVPAQSIQPRLHSSTHQYTWARKQVIFKGTWPNLHFYVDQNPQLWDLVRTAMLAKAYIVFRYESTTNAVTSVEVSPF